MKIIICSGRFVIEINGNVEGKKVLVIKSRLSAGKRRAVSPEEESERNEIDARKIADFLNALPGPVFLQLTNIMKKRAGELRRKIQERENYVTDMIGSWPNISDYSRRNLERYAGVLGLDRVHNWDDIKNALGLSDLDLMGEMEESLRKRIIQELKLSEETNWSGIALALGLSKPVPFYQIVEALREKRALALGLPKTASWKTIRNK